LQPIRQAHSGKKMKKQEAKSVSRNPLQDKATKNQSPSWLKDKETPGQEEIPANLRPHPFVDAQLADPPDGSEGAEGVSGQQDPEFEDEPAN
jgi:hypothetical protein